MKKLLLLIAIVLLPVNCGGEVETTGELVHLNQPAPEGCRYADEVLTCRSDEWSLMCTLPGAQVPESCITVWLRPDNEVGYCCEGDL